MALPAPADNKLTLDRVREQFEHWRRTREKKGAIPEALWETAVSLHTDYSLCQISKVLRLGYNDLKNRVQAQKSNFTSQSDASFIELGISDPRDIVKCCGLSVPFSKQILSIFLHNFRIVVELHFSQKNKALTSPISSDLKLIHIGTLAA